MTEACCWTKLPGGWCITYIRMQGPEIVHMEAISEVPEPKDVAARKLAAEIMARFSASGAGGRS